MIDFKECVKKFKQRQKEVDITDPKYTQAMLLFYANLCYKDGDDDGLTEDEYLTLCYCKRFNNYVPLDTVAGCLIGGAIGDAFGVPVEFMDDAAIFKRYGENGITQLQLYGGVAHISDDTQMTLFTADGLISAEKRFQNPTADEYIECIYESYLNWLCTQDGSFVLDENTAKSELLNVKELHHQRAPGTTCLTVLRSGQCGTFTHKLNNSKGCGGIMRVAPIAVYLAQKKHFKERDIALVAARAAAITHSHPLGYIPAAYFAALIVFLCRGDDFIRAIRKTNVLIDELFAGVSETKQCLELVEKARNLAFPDDDEQALDDLEAIRLLGEGWVAEETLAISLYCALKYHEDFQKAMVAAANHSGDSDSTAAVAGNILGAYWGLKRLPQDMVECIELKDVTMDIASKLYINKLV